MDPYIECQEWEDFHTRFNTSVCDSLAPAIEPRYIARVERRVYVEHPASGDDDVRWADVAVLTAEPSVGLRSGAASASAAVVAPVECVLPMPEERRETFLVIRERQTMEIVTVIETLSPANKRAGSDGRKQYLEKRNEVLASRSHLIELDLLRGGLRLPTITPLPRADYYAIVSRRHTRPRAQVYAWTIRDPLQTIPVPLKRGDPDVSLDLQLVFTTVYDRARYGLSLNYAQPLDPPLSEHDAEWARHLVEKTGSR
jgi:hypothetical protein